MKSKLIAFAISLTLLFFHFTLSSAQTYIGSEAEKLVKNSTEVRVDETRKSISFVRLNENGFVSAHAADQWLLKSVFHGRSEDGLLLIKSENDKLGFAHDRYRQLYQNIPVEFSMYIVHSQNGKIISANGEYYPGITVSDRPALNKSEALQAAENTIHANNYKKDPAIISPPELVVIKTEDGRFRFAYKTDVYAEEPLSRNWIYVDAVNGEIVKKINRIETVDVSASAITHYSGTKSIRVDSLSAASFRLRESARGTGNGTITRNLQNGSNYGTAVDFTRTTNSWPLTYDNSALDAHYGAEKTYDHYYNNYGRNSFDNSGGSILSYVHYSFNYVNAFWDGTEMTYGDGDGVQYLPLTSLEIVGHEITHGVTERSANLVYSGESGALNESFSDIMGITIRFNNDPALATWYCGDQIVIAGSGGTPFRNMANPNDFNCADTYGGLYWNYGDIVHYDSGVQNFWYYLLSAGGNGVNDNGNSYTVNGIGLTDANAIAFRNLTYYLTPNATFADARTYSILAATDLFGNCSNQVIQTTNAWYAVGVGGVFSNAVVSSFTATQNYFCTSPATVYFSNHSFNATSYAWNFGDGNTSSAMNPSHVYSAPGNYTVQLVAMGSASCGNSDTMVLTNYITVTNVGGPVSPNCTPVAVSNCCNIGITKVQFNTINKSSGNATEGYRDFTCSDVTTITAGDPVPLTVTTGLTNNENVKAWIDYNNDGILNSANELVFVSNNQLGHHSGIVYTPPTAVLNTPLRMRVLDENSSYIISSSCYNPLYGQAEDYSVTFLANTLPPVAGFMASDSVISVGSTISFNDLSIHVPTSWSWSCPGGTPTTSTTQNPTVQYSTLGIYPVTLHVYNSFGSDSITKTSYIHVVNVVDMCTTTYTTFADGQLYDSGGPSANYSSYENCSLLIAPPCALGITMSFTSFLTGSGSDYLTIYDGPNTLSPILLSASGSTLPPTVTAHSGQMYVVFASNYNYNYPGFAGNWTSVLASDSIPVADFIMSDSTPPLNTPVQFTDISTHSPISWIWVFGDGGSSTLQNPTHAYANPGTYTVTLLAFTCSQSAAVTHTVTVQAAPSALLSEDTLYATASCGGTATVPLTVYNTGGGDLVYSTGGTSSGHLNVLAFTYGSDTTQEYPNTLAAMNQYFTNYNLSRYSGTNAAALQTALVGKNVLLFPEHENSLSTVYPPLATVVQNFVNAGGTIVVCGSGPSYANRIFDLGLFTGSYVGNDPPGLTTLDTTDAITDNVPITFSPPNATYYMNFTNPDKVKLVQYTGVGNDVVTYRHIGLGIVVYVGFDYFQYNNATAQLVANSVSLPNTTNVQWISPVPSSDTVAAGDSSVIQVTFSTYGLFAGIHTSNLVVHTNDPLHPIINVVCSLTVTGRPVIGLSGSCLNFGSTMQHTVTTDTLYIRNNGCDTLHVTGIVPPFAEYTAVPSGNILIPPYDSSMVIVHFAPNTIGAFNGNLIIHNNDVDTVVCLTATSFAAPSISTDPTSFHVTMHSCNDSLTLPLVIYNQGGSNLNYVMSGTGNSFSGDTSVLVIQETDAWGIYMSSFLQSHYGITPVVITSSQIAATDFSLYNVIITVSDESVGYYSAISANVTKFQNFVSSGGIVQYQMAMQGTDTVYLPGGARVIYGNMQNLNNVLLPAHPILNGVTNPINGNYANHSYLDNLPVGSHVLTETGTLSLPTTVEYNYGSGLVIATGMTWEWLFNNGNNAGLMLPNSTAYAFSKLVRSSSWITLSSSSGTITPSDSELVYVTFHSSGLSNGVYTANVIIGSNDPLIPNDTIPCTLTLTGTPVIALSKSCLNFGSILEHAVGTDTLYIRNQGCDTLHVTGIVPSIPEYTSVPSGNLNILPHDSSMVIVHFSPASIGTYNGNLVIHDNDVDTVVCLHGVAVPAPVISTHPTSFNVHLNACNDSITLPLEILNTGGSNLTYTITGGNPSGGVANVLALTYGTDLSTEYPNTLAAINQYFTNYNLTTINTTNASALQAALVGKNIFLMTEPESGTPSVYGDFATVLQNFVSNGGIAILCGAYAGQSDCILNTGLFSGSWGADANSQNVSVVNTSTPITTGLPSTFLGTNGTFCLNITNGNKVKLVDYSGMDVVTYRNIGFGKAIFIAFDFFSYGTNQALIVSNAMRWAATNSGASWISVLPLSGTTTPGDSSEVAVTFYSLNFPAGTYNGSIVIHSNDPTNLSDTIPCVLTVSSNPCGEFSYTAGACSGIVSFTSSVINNPTSYSWSFGDGGTSVAANPSHTYTTAGTYQVRLIVCNAFGCDTIAKSVNLLFINGPVTASCYPQTTANCCGIGILNVTFNTINNNSPDGVDGYKDYSCLFSTSVVKGQNYSISVQTGATYSENVKVWIDFNNNGIFETSELVYTSLAQLQSHTGSVAIPASGVVLNTPLRMRVGSDYSGNPVPDPCTAVQYGQFEDYTVGVTVNVDVPSISATHEFTVYPNPFTGETTVNYTLSASRNITLEVYNVIGEKVTTILSGHEQQAGSYSYRIKVDAVGIYLVKMTTEDGTEIRRVVRLE